MNFRALHLIIQYLDGDEVYFSRIKLISFLVSDDQLRLRCYREHPHKIYTLKAHPHNVVIVASPRGDTALGA